LTLIVFLKFNKTQILKTAKNDLKFFLAAGLLYGLASIIQLLSLAKIYVAYTISIKRAGLIFAVIFGYLFFKEKQIGARLLGATIMVIGVLLITLLG